MTSLDDWKCKKLTDLATYINGYAFKPEDWSKDGLPIIRIEQLKNPSLINDYYSGKLPEKNKIVNGDLIFSWSATLFLKIWQHGESALNQHLFKVIENENVDKCFLKQFIEFNLPEIIKLSHGSTMQHITRKELDRFKALFPIQLLEQETIAKILETVECSIDQTEAIIAKQKRIKTGLIQDLLTKGIDECGNIRTEETHVFKDSPLGRIPVEWNVTTIDNIAEFVTSGSRGWAKYYGAEGDLFLRIGNLTREHINLRFDDVIYVQPTDTSEGKRTAVKTGDILISITADLGIIGVIPESFGVGYVNQHIALVRHLEEIVNPRFIGWFLMSIVGQVQFDAGNESGAKAGLNLTTVRNLKIPNVDIKEQNKIAMVLDQSARVIDNYIKDLNKLKHLKTALMQDLLTGKKRVTPLLKRNEVKFDEIRQDI